MKRLKVKIITGKVVEEWITNSYAYHTLYMIRRSLDKRIQYLKSLPDVNPFAKIPICRKKEIMKKVLVAKRSPNTRMR